MFKKKPNIKTLSPLRSSDRRKTADRIINDYGLQIAQTDVSIDDAAITAARTALRNSILPDNALSAKFDTTHGPDLKKITGTVYIGSHDRNEQRVLWIKIEETMYPSVYTLWHNPGIVPLLHTPSLVIGKLQGGADLMTPGLAGPPFPGKATKGAVVAVASLDHPTVPLVVGTCLIDISSLTDARGAKGQAVETFHWSGDHVWDWSTSGKAGISAPTELEGWGFQIDGNLLASNLDNLELEDQAEPAGGVSLGDALDPVADDLASARNPHLDGEDIVERVNEEDISTAEIDRVFKQAFLYGVHQQQQNHLSAPKHGFAFPLTQSFVISNLINPYLPTFTAKQTEAYNIKKTSWKNAKKFIKQLDKDKLILSKDTKTEVVILDIDFDDMQIRNFRPYRLPKKDVPVVSGSAGHEASSGGDDTIGQTLKVINLYRPKESLAPLFKAAELGTKSSYTKAELVPIITHYIESENLLAVTNKRMVKLDPFLANSIFNTSQRSDNEILAKGSVPRDILIDRALAACAPFHSIESSSDSGTSTHKPKAGLAPRIEIILETRSGNKTATRVHGFEPYHIHAQPLADELRKTCAGSTSVEPYKAGKGNVMEVMVQGPQRDSVIKALEKRGVARAWMDVIDKTKKK